jgi:DNA-binding response OmpR family regulator
MAKPQILLIEDDAAIRHGLRDALQLAGYDVLMAADGDKGVSVACSTDCSLVLLDVMLPGKDGFAVLEELRELKPDLPVIMVTARGLSEDRIRGLKRGADDYVVKPFSIDELLARLEAVLRRSPTRATPKGRVAVAGRCIDFDRSEAELPDGTHVLLSEKEVALLRYLWAHRERVVTREELLSRVWGLDPRGLQTRTVDMHVARIRERLRDDQQQPAVILTVRARGYRLGESPHG